MTSRLRHRIDDDGVAIIGSRDGFLSTTIRTTEREALKAAWAILSDLDPEEVDEIQLAQGERRRQMIRSRMIRFMAVTPATLSQMAAVLGISARDLSGYLLPMRRAGLVERTNERVGRTPAIFQLTPAGLHALAKEGLAQIARQSSFQKPAPVGELFEVVSSPAPRRRRRNA